MEHWEINFLGDRPWLAILAALVFWAVTYFYYRRTTPPLARAVKIILIFFRAVAVAALFLALAQPMITIFRTDDIPKRAALIIDRSASMKLPVRPGEAATREELADRILGEGDLTGLMDRLAVDRYSLAESLAVENKGPNLSGRKTDFGTAFRQLQTISAASPYNMVFLISDGRATDGEALADAAAVLTGVPVYTIAVGDSSRTRDLALLDVRHSQVLYEGKPAEITAVLTQTGDFSGPMRLTLTENGRELAQKTFSSLGDGKTSEQVLSFTPSAPGRLILELAVRSGDDEAETGNNRRSVAVRVLKGRINILLYSSSLNQEYAFLNRYLRSQNDYDVTTVLDAIGGDRLGERFPATQERLNSFDALIFIDPNLRRLSAQAERLETYLSERGGGLLILMGENYARSAAGNPIESLSPLAVSKPVIVYENFHLVPEPRMLFHPAVGLGTGREEIEAVWAGQPPFTIAVDVDSLRSAGVALAYLDGGFSRRPVCGLALRRLGAGKILAAAVSPFWNWAFYPVGVGRDASIYRQFFAGALRWLTIGDESDRLNFGPVKKIFGSADEVAFTGTVQDEGFRPIIGASGEVVVVSDQGDTIIDRIVADPARLAGYRSDLGLLPPGAYNYRAEIFADKIRLGRFDGVFGIEAIDRETALAGVDWSALAEAANRTGGLFVTYGDLSPITGAVDATSTHIEESRGIRLWDHVILLVIILSALSGEWILRKNRQLL